MWVRCDFLNLVGILSGEVNQRSWPGQARFKKGGSTKPWAHFCKAFINNLAISIPTACSQVTDGAAVVLMMTRREAARRGLPVLGIFRSFAAVRPSVSSFFSNECSLGPARPRGGLDSSAGPIPALSQSLAHPASLFCTHGPPAPSQR